MNDQRPQSCNCIALRNLTMRQLREVIVHLKSHKVKLETRSGGVVYVTWTDDMREEISSMIN